MVKSITKDIDIDLIFCIFYFTFIKFNLNFYGFFFLGFKLIKNNSLRIGLKRSNKSITYYLIKSFERFKDHNLLFKLQTIFVINQSPSLIDH